MTTTPINARMRPPQGYASLRVRDCLRYKREHMRISDCGNDLGLLGSPHGIRVTPLIRASERADGLTSFGVLSCGVAVSRIDVALLLRELTRLARFGANLADAFSCLIFLPDSLVTSRPARTQSSSARVNLSSETRATAGPIAKDHAILALGGAHTLSTALIPHASIAVGNGLIGWVAKHRRAIHVSPFDRDSTTLGIYSSDQQLKSFIGVPIALSSGDESESLVGVLTCDSKKSFAFTKIQGKLLEDLAEQIALIVSLCRRPVTAGSDGSWQSFVSHAGRLTDALGLPAVEALRVRIANLSELEQGAGTASVFELSDQIFRLIQQALPPHFPAVRTPQGDIVLLVDNMMTSFYENKIRAVCERITQPHGIIKINFIRRSARNRSSGVTDIESLVADSAVEEVELTQSAALAGGAPTKRGGSVSPVRGGRREYRQA